MVYTMIQHALWIWNDIWKNASHWRRMHAGLDGIFRKYKNRWISNNSTLWWPLVTLTEPKWYKKEDNTPFHHPGNLGSLLKPLLTVGRKVGHFGSHMEYANERNVHNFLRHPSRNTCKNETPRTKTSTTFRCWSR